MTQLGDLIRTARDGCGWTRADLARKSGVPHTTIYNIEMNEKPVQPKPLTLARLAAALDLSREQVFRAAGYPNEHSASDAEREARKAAALRDNPALEQAFAEVSKWSEAEQDMVLTLISTLRQRRANRRRPHPPRSE